MPRLSEPDRRLVLSQLDGRLAGLEDRFRVKLEIAVRDLRQELGAGTVPIAKAFAGAGDPNTRWTVADFEDRVSEIEQNIKKSLVSRLNRELQTGLEDLEAKVRSMIGRRGGVEMLASPVEASFTTTVGQLDDDELVARVTGHPSHAEMIGQHVDRRLEAHRRGLETRWKGSMEGSSAATAQGYRSLDDDDLVARVTGHPSHAEAIGQHVDRRLENQIKNLESRLQRSIVKEMSGRASTSLQFGGGATPASQRRVDLAPPPTASSSASGNESGQQAGGRTTLDSGFAGELERKVLGVLQERLATTAEEMQSVLENTLSKKMGEMLRADHRGWVGASSSSAEGVSDDGRLEPRRTSLGEIIASGTAAGRGVPDHLPNLERLEKRLKKATLAIVDTKLEDAIHELDSALKRLIDSKLDRHSTNAGDQFKTDLDCLEAKLRGHVRDSALGRGQTISSIGSRFQTSIPDLFQVVNICITSFHVTLSNLS